MVVEVIAGIALMKQGVGAIKGLIHTCKDVNDITQHLSDVLSGHEHVHKKLHKAKSKPLTRWHLYFKQTIGKNQEEAEDSLAHIAAEVIEKRQADAVLKQVQRAVNKRFPGAWDEVIDTYNERKKQAKKLAEERKKQAILKAKEEEVFREIILHWFIQIGKLLLIFGGAALMGWLIWINRCTQGTC